MYESERQLKSKIYYFEDRLLISKNPYEIEQLRGMLTTLRMKLQKLHWENSKGRA